VDQSQKMIGIDAL